MPKSTRDITKADKRKRPPEPGTPVLVRLQAEPLKRLDDWRRKQPNIPTRAEAMRQLIDIALKPKGEKS